MFHEYLYNCIMGVMWVYSSPWVYTWTGCRRSVLHGGQLHEQTHDLNSASVCFTIWGWQHVISKTCHYTHLFKVWWHLARSFFSLYITIALQKVFFTIMQFSTNLIVTSSFALHFLVRFFVCVCDIIFLK